MTCATWSRTIITIALLSFVIAAHLPSAAAADDPTRPNILYIMSDDHAAQAIGCYGSRINRTPNLDRIAREGMRFDSCLVTNSICTPSRAAILTGKYAHVTGVKTFVPLDRNAVTLAQLLHAAGYYTAAVGKWHLMVEPVGFDDYSVLPGQGRYFDPEFIEKKNVTSPVEQWNTAPRTVNPGYVTDVITDKVLDYLEHGRPKDHPFLMLYHHKAPHDTWQYDAKHADLYTDPIPEPATLFDDYATRASALSTTTQKIGQLHTLYEAETGHLEGRARKSAQYQEYMRRYLRCVASVDDNVGRVLDYLDRSGLAENTIVIYTSDQGFFLGEHGLYDKRFMYEDSLRMPFLIRWPGHIAPGSVNRDLVLNVDFAPTLLDCAGAAVPADMQGRSFRSILEGHTPANWRTAMYYRYYFSHFETEPHYGVRTLDRKLIHYPRTGEWELFDLTSDPNELRNVYDESRYTDDVQQLKAMLDQLRTELGDDEE